MQLIELRPSLRQKRSYLYLSTNREHSTLQACNSPIKEATKRQDKDVQYGHGELNVNSQMSTCQLPKCQLFKFKVAYIERPWLGQSQPLLFLIVATTLSAFYLAEL